ncbi:hypothetical protein TWF481_006213 [Arthrobotrys musiformis]|uniref:Uncharacterized protein n=1 Tax=Arthrobotrys musiformis TaxID=47236 RepID=A0AAV9WG33_9PEZI
MERFYYPFVSEEKIIDGAQPSTIRLFGEWYNVQVTFCYHLGSFWYEGFGHALKREDIVSLFSNVEQTLLNSLRRQKKSIGSIRKDFTQDYYIHHLSALKDMHNVGGQPDKFNEVYEAMRANIRQRNYFQKSKFPCFVAADYPYHDLVEHEKEIVQLAIWAELIMAGIESMRSEEVSAKVFLAWFLRYTTLTTKSFANRVFLPFWDWIEPRVDLTRGAVFEALHRCTWLPSVLLEPQGSQVVIDIPMSLGRAELIGSSILIEDPAGHCPGTQIIVPESDVRKPLSRCNPCGKWICPCDIHCSSSRSPPPGANPETGEDIAILKLERLAELEYEEVLDPGMDELVLKSPMKIIVSGGLPRCRNEYFGTEIYDVRQLWQVARLQTLTFLHISGGDYLSCPDRDPSIGGIVDSLNWIFKKLPSLQNFYWDELPPCHDYEFESLISFPQYLRTFEMMSGENDLDLKGYFKVDSPETQPEGPNNLNEICLRFSEMVEESVLEYFYIRIMYGPRYVCKTTERRSENRFIEFMGLTGVERVNWASEWKWEKGIGAPLSRNPISYKVHRCEWERDEIRHRREYSTNSSIIYYGSEKA